MAPKERDKSKSKSKSRERRGHCFLCGRDSKQLCTACERVHYCSQDHYLAHRQQNYCFPYRIGWKSGKGRCVLATRDISALELILFDAAIVTGPRNSTVPVCLECGKTADGSYRCGMCGMPVCNEACQVGKIHSEECQLFRNLKKKTKTFNFKEKESTIYPYITPIRLLMKKQTNPRAYRRLQFLMDHRDSIPQAEEAADWLEHKLVINLLLEAFGLTNNTVDDVLWAMGILMTNCVMFGESSGRALFPLFSLINHSCTANAKHTMYIQNKRIALQAQTDLKEGEEICINYVAFIHGTYLRREKLEKFWHFRCECERCADPTELGSHLSSLKCGKCDGGILVQQTPLIKESPWVCSIHTFTISAKNNLQLVQSMKQALYGGNEAPTIARLERLLVEFAEYLHPHHNLMMIIKRNIISLYSQQPLRCLGKTDFLRIRHLCEESIRVLEKVDPGYPLWRAETLKDLSTCLLNLARTEYEEGNITRPEFLERVKAAMRLVEQASKCKACVKLERKMEDGTSVTEEISNV